MLIQQCRVHVQNQADATHVQQRHRVKTTACDHLRHEQVTSVDESKTTQLQCDPVN